MENLNEVLPQYRITKNDEPVVGGDCYEDISEDYNTMVGSSDRGDVIRLMDTGRTIKVTTIGTQQ